MEFYKSDEVYTEKALKYTGFTVEAGAKGKVVVVAQDGIKVLWDKDKRQLARLAPPTNITKTSEVPYDEFLKKAAFRDFRVGKSVVSLAKDFMEEEDYEVFKKLMALKNLYIEENNCRQMDGLKSMKDKIKDINDKMDVILDNYKSLIIDEFGINAKASTIDALVKKALNKEPWKQEKKIEKLKSQSVDTTKGDEDKIPSAAQQGEDAVPPGEATLTTDQNAYG